MPNVALITDDGLPLILPSTAITSILSVRRAPNKEHPDAKAVAFSTFRGSTVHFLGQGPAEVLEEVRAKASKDDERVWIVLPIGDEASYVLADSLTLAEGVKDGEETFLRVWFRRPDGLDVYADADFSEQLVESVTAALDKRKDA